MPTSDDTRYDHEAAARNDVTGAARVDDVRIGAVRPLITPSLLLERVPMTGPAQALVESSRAAISRVLHGGDDRLVVVVGPCSIHDHDQASCSWSCAPTSKSRAPPWAGRVTSTTRTSTAASR
jgi:3-deoxy-7-phosphoheptulonate synthase